MTSRRWFAGRGDRTAAVHVERVATERFRVHVEGREDALEVTVLGGSTPTAVTVDGRVVTVFSTKGGVVTHPSRERIELSSRPRRGAGDASGQATAESLLRAPMPGRVLKLLVAEGQTVSTGAPLVVIEAMKMENELSAPRAGVVKRIRVQVGDTVERDSAILELE